MNEERSDLYYTQVSESIKSIFELTTRVDERVQYIMKKQEELDKKIDVHMQSINELNSRIKVLESKTNAVELAEEINVLYNKFHDFDLRLNKMELENSKHESRWKTTISFVLQLIWVILAAFILYKLGIQSPQTP